jgi:hypothetical protein
MSKIKDQNQINWCTNQNFSNIYDGVYWSMVKAIVAVETYEERLYDKKGERVLDENLIYGRPKNLK